MCPHCLGINHPVHKESPVSQSVEGYKRDKKFFRELEEVLDEYFPKVEEEGEEKRLMKRGDALMIFSAANMIHSRSLTTLVKKMEGMRIIEKCIAHRTENPELCNGECRNKIGFNAGISAAIEVVKKMGV